MKRSVWMIIGMCLAICLAVGLFGGAAAEPAEEPGYSLELHSDIAPDDQGIVNMPVHGKIWFTVTGDDQVRHQARQVQLSFTETGEETEKTEELNPYLLMSRGFEMYDWVPNDDEQDAYTYTVYARALVADDEHPDGEWVSSDPLTVRVDAGDIISAPDYTVLSTTRIPKDGELVVSVTNNGADYYGCYIKNENWRMDSRWVTAEDGDTTEVRMPVFYCEPGEYDAWVYAVKRGAKQAENATPIQFIVTGRANNDPIILNVKDSFLTDERIRIYARYENSGSDPLDENDAWIRVRVYETDDPEHEVWWADGDGFYYWTDALRIGEAGNYTVEAEIREMTDWTDFSSEHTVEGTTTYAYITVSETEGAAPLSTPDAALAYETVMQGGQQQITFTGNANAERYSWQVVNCENEDRLMQGETIGPATMSIDTTVLDSGLYRVETEASARGYRSGYGTLYFVVTDPEKETEIRGEGYFFSCTAKAAEAGTGADFCAETGEEFQLRYYVPGAEEVRLLRRMDSWPAGDMDPFDTRDGMVINQTCSLSDRGFWDIYGCYQMNGEWTEPAWLCTVEVTADRGCLETPRADIPTVLQDREDLQIVYHVDGATESFGYWISYEDDWEQLYGEGKDRECLNPENTDGDGRRLYTFTIPAEVLETGRAYHIYLDVNARGYTQAHADRTLYVVGNPVDDGSVVIYMPVEDNHPVAQITFSETFPIKVYAEDALDTHVWCEATQDFRDEAGSDTTTWYNIDRNPGDEKTSCDFYAIARYSGSYIKLSPTLTLPYVRPEEGEENAGKPTLELENGDVFHRGDRIEVTVGAVADEDVTEYVLCMEDEDGNLISSESMDNAGKTGIDTRYLQEGNYTLYAYARVTGKYRTDSDPVYVTIRSPEISLWYNGTKLANGGSVGAKSANRKFYYRIDVTGLPEGVQEIQLGWNENLNATKPFRNEWETRWLEEDDDGMFIRVIPALSDSYTSEVMFARLDEQDSGTRIKLYYKRTKETHDKPVIDTATPPALGQRDYELTWTGPEGAEFYRVIWKIKDDNNELIDGYEYEAWDTSLYLEDVWGDPTGYIGNYEVQVVPFGNGRAWTASTVWTFRIDAPDPVLEICNDEVTLEWDEDAGAYTSTVPMHQWMDFAVWAPGAEVFYYYCEDEPTDEPQHMLDGLYFNGEDRLEFKYTPNELPDGFDPDDTSYTKYLYVDVCYNRQTVHRTLAAVITVSVNEEFSNLITYSVPDDVNTPEEGEEEVWQVARDGRFFVDVENNDEADFYGMYIARAGVDASDDYRDWIADSHWIPKSEGETTRVPLTVPRCETGGYYDVHVYGIRFGAPKAEAAERATIHVTEMTETEDGCPVIVSMGKEFKTGEPIRVFVHYTNPDEIQGWMTVRIHNTEDERDVIFEETGHDFDDFWDMDASARHSGRYAVDTEIWTWSDEEGNHIHAFYDDIFFITIKADGPVAAPVISAPAFLAEGQDLVFTIDADLREGEAAPAGYEYTVVRSDTGWQWITGGMADAGNEPVSVTLDKDLLETGAYLIWVTAYRDNYDSATAEARFAVTRTTEGQITLKVNGSTAAEQTTLSSTDVEVKVETDPEHRPTAVRILNNGEWDYLWDEQGDFERIWHYAGGDEVIYAEATYDTQYDFEELADNGWDKPNGRRFDWNRDVQWTAVSNAILLHVDNPYGTIAVPDAELLNDADADGEIVITQGSDLIIRINDDEIRDTDGAPIRAGSNSWYACHIEKWEEGDRWWNRVWQDVKPQLHGGVNYIPTYTLWERGTYRVEIGADAQGYEGVSRYLTFRFELPDQPPETDMRFTADGTTGDRRVPVNKELDLVAYYSNAEWIDIEITRAGDENWHEGRSDGGSRLADSWAPHEVGEYTLKAYGCGRIRDGEWNEITDENGNSDWRELIGEITVTAEAADDPLAEPAVTVNGSTGAAVTADAQDEHTLTIEISTVENGTDYHLRLSEYGEGYSFIDRDLKASAANEGKLTLTITDRRIRKGQAYELCVDAWAIGYAGSRTQRAFLLRDAATAATVELSVDEGEYWTADDIRVNASAEGATAYRIHVGNDTRYCPCDEVVGECFTLWNTENLIYVYATKDSISRDEETDWESLNWSLQSDVLFIHANTHGEAPIPDMYVPEEVVKGQWLEIHIEDGFQPRNADLWLRNEYGDEVERLQVQEGGTYRLSTDRLEAGETCTVGIDCVQSRHTWACGWPHDVRVVAGEEAPEAFFRADRTTVCTGEDFNLWVFSPGAVRVWITNDNWTPESGSNEDILREWDGENGSAGTGGRWQFYETGNHVLKAWAEDEENHISSIGQVTITVTDLYMLERVNITVNQDGAEDVAAVDVTKAFEVQIHPTVMYGSRYTLQIHMTDMETRPVLYFEQSAAAADEEGRVTFHIPANRLWANESYWIDCHAESRNNRYCPSDSSKNIMTKSGEDIDENLLVYINSEWGTEEDGAIRIPVSTAFDVEISVADNGTVPAAIAVHMGDRCEYDRFNGDNDNRMTMRLEESQPWPETLYVQACYGQIEEGTAWEDMNWREPTEPVKLSFFGRGLDNAEISVHQGGEGNLAVADATEEFEIRVPLVDHGYEYILQLHQTDMENKPVYRWRLTDRNADEDGILTFPIAGGLLEANRSYWIDCYVSSMEAGYYSSDSSRNIMTTAGSTTTTVSVSLADEWLTERGYEIPVFVPFEVTVSLNGVTDPRPTGAAVHMGDYCEYRIIPADADSITLTMCEGQAWPETIFAQVCYEEIGEGDNTDWEGFQWSEPSAPVTVTFTAGRLETPQILIKQGENEDVSAVDVTEDFEIVVPLIDGAGGYRLTLHKPNEVWLEQYLSSEDAEDGKVTWTIFSDTGLEANQTYWIDCLADPSEERPFCDGSSVSRSFITTGAGGADSTLTVSTADTVIPINQPFSVTVSYSGPANEAPTAIALTMGDRTEYRAYNGEAVSFGMSEYQPYQEALYARATRDDLSGYDGQEIPWEDLSWGNASAAIMMTFTSHGGAEAPEIAYPEVIMDSSDLVITVTVGAHANEAHANLDENTSQWGPEQLILPNGWEGTGTLPDGTKTATITIPSEMLRTGTFMLKVDSSGIGYDNTRTQGIIRIVPDPEWIESKLTLPASLQEIEEEAFSGISAEAVIIPGQVTTIGRYAFAYSNIRYAVIPNNVTSVGDGAFAGCSLEVVYGGAMAEEIAEACGAIYCGME